MTQPKESNMATANCNVDRGALAKPRLDVIHQIVAWDIEDGGEMGALIRCTTCDGDGTNWDFSHPKAPMMSAYSVICEMCGGSGTLQRGYSYFGAIRTDGAGWIYPRRSRHS